MRLSPWILQILILAAGIHLFLRFVRTTRGSRLIRGLLMTVVVLFVGLWSLSKLLDLEELSHLLHGSTGFILVAFVIVFQPEMRRAVAQLGGTSVVGRLMNPAAGDTLRRVVRAARSMASRRCGALIAFERETSLPSSLEAGTEIDAGVTARLIETIFHPGSPLHDGGVVIRRDRVAEAGCIFPLPQQSGGVDPRLGTRHRAAMGLTEDSDAVVLVVSEETGAISLAHRGHLRTVISPDEVEDQLRRLIEGGDSGSTSERDKRGGRALAWRRDLVWLPASILLAAGILYVAHQDIRVSKEFIVSIAAATPERPRSPKDGELLVLLPGEDYQLVAGKERRKVVVSGTRAQLEEVGEELSGTFAIGEADQDELALVLSGVSWQRPVLGLGYQWSGEDVPLLRLGRYVEERVALAVEDVTIDATRLNKRYEIFRDRIAFDPEASLVLRGPAEAGERALSSLLEPIVVSEDDLSDLRERVRLTDEALAEGFSLEGSVDVTVPIGPARRDAGTLTKEIAMIALDPSRTQDLGNWSLPAHAQTARFRIETAGLIPAGSDPASPAYRERVQAIRNYVNDNLLVYVDLSELPPQGEGQSLEVRFYLREDWRGSLDSLGGFEKNRPAGRESLEVRLESDERIRLERRAPTAANGTDGPGAGN